MCYSYVSFLPLPNVELESIREAVYSLILLLYFFPLSWFHPTWLVAFSLHFQGHQVKNETVPQNLFQPGPRKAGPRGP